MGSSDKDETVIIAAEHVSKVGQIVTLDVETGKCRSITGGVLTATRDDFGTTGDLERSHFTIGGKDVCLDWDSGQVDATLRVEGKSA